MRNGSLLLLLPLQNPFCDVTCGRVIWAIPAGSLELSGQQQTLCTLLSGHEALKLLLTFTLSPGTQPLLAASLLGVVTSFSVVTW